MRRALGHPPVVAAEGRAVRAARRRHDPRDRQRRHRLRDPQRACSPTGDRDHHLPRVRRRVGGAAAVRRAGRSRRHLPRPAPARAAADVRPAADRRRLRASPRSARSHRSCSRSRSSPRSCCSSATCSSATARSTTSPATSTCCGRSRRGRSCWRCYYAVVGVAIASLTDRRIVAGAAIIGLFLVTSITSGDHRRRRLRVRRRLRSPR